MSKLKQKFFESLRGRNGMDDIGKTVLITSFLAYFLSVFLRNRLLWQKYSDSKRQRENRGHLSVMWKLKIL